MMKITTTVAGFLSLWIPAVSMAGQETLSIGDQAPAVEVAHWLKGAPVSEFEPGKVYVLEFWATWCAPCKASIPHISELQKQYEDYNVTFIGVSDEKLQTVVKFMCYADRNNVLWNEKIHYTLATDPDRSTHGAYMLPAARETIPTAFIIGKDQRIEWIGRPMEMDKVLDAVVRDNWDRDAFGVEYEEAVAPVRKLLKLRAKVESAADRGDWDGAMAAADEIAEDNPGYERIRTSLFRKMLKNADPATTYAYGRTIMKASWDNAGALNGLAWYTVDLEGVRSRDLPFAKEAAERASTLTNNKNAGILDTVARVYYEMGEIEAAIQWQRKAVENATGAAMADQLKEVLAKYRKVAESRL